jgi:hypothetical protein
MVLGHLLGRGEVGAGPCLARAPGFPGRHAQRGAPLVRGRHAGCQRPWPHRRRSRERPTTIQGPPLVQGLTHLTHSQVLPDCGFGSGPSDRAGLSQKW